ncbi:MAG: FG-GAP repeat protein [Myxococcales bacterium]|nr:FG-GAP repeat protein [Myxococcales bacterium]
MHRAAPLGLVLVCATGCLQGSDVPAETQPTTPDPVQPVAPDPTVPEPDLQLSTALKQMGLAWNPAPTGAWFELDELHGSSRIPLGTYAGDVTDLWIDVALHRMDDVSYELRTCTEAACSASFVRPSAAQLTEAIGYLKPDGPLPHSELGHAVAVCDDGSVVAVGAPFDSPVDGDDTDTRGSVAVFERGPDGTWTLEAHLWLSNGRAEDRFGHAVALSGDCNTLAVGAPNRSVEDGPGAPRTGVVEVFEHIGATWARRASLFVGDDGDAFGHAVAVDHDGDRFLVGAPHDDGPEDNFPSMGAVYLIETAGVFVAPTRLDFEGWGLAEFGYAVAMTPDGTQALVGAPREFGQGKRAPKQHGVVYLLELDSGGAEIQEILRPRAPVEGQAFGASVALDDEASTLAIGSPGVDTVYVYERGQLAWTDSPTRLQPTGAGARFGHALSLSADGGSLLASAPSESSGGFGVQPMDHAPSPDSGSAYLFVHDDTWAQRTHLKAPNTSDGDAFGTSVALSADGHTAVVGAPLEDGSASGVHAGNVASDDLTQQTGAAYLY